MIMPQHAFGRLVAPDARDTRYPMRLALDLEVPLPPWKYWVTGPVLNQGIRPYCVGFAWAQWLMTSPTRTKNGPAGPEIYHAAQLVDEWQGEDYEGTSVRAGAKVMQGQGRIASYLWARSVEELQRWVLLNGPVVLGTAWLQGMMDVDSRGFVNLIGGEVGGHAYLCNGWSANWNAFRCVNSWGKGWGQNGRFWLRVADLDRLLGENGEACAAVEQAVVSGRMTGLGPRR